MKTNNTKYRLTVSALTLLVTLMCMAAALLIPLETTTVKIVGSLASVFIVSAAAWKFPKRFYLFALIFDIFAAALGSVINLYKYIGFYDRFVHYLSGILLAEAGMLIITYIISVRKIEKDNLIMMLFAFFFSASCAGFWEIYEFTADNLLKTNMQGANNNTMGDIVSGVLGAITYVVIRTLFYKRKKKTGVR